jgi:predicted RNA-binding Zn-ribbon protein involved in translation (DUF1610 family)
MICAGCGRRVRRNKSVRYDGRVVYSTELRSADDIKVFNTQTAYYCPSCGKHRHIYEKKKRQAMKKYNR